MSKEKYENKHNSLTTHRDVEAKVKWCKKKPNRAFQLAKHIAGTLYVSRMANGDFHTVIVQ